LDQSCSNVDHKLGKSLQDSHKTSARGLNTSNMSFIILILNIESKILVRFSDLQFFRSTIQLTSYHD
jgi:hypothetical protein